MREKTERNIKLPSAYEWMQHYYVIDNKKNAENAFFRTDNFKPAHNIQIILAKYNETITIPICLICDWAFGISFVFLSIVVSQNNKNNSVYILHHIKRDWNGFTRNWLICSGRRHTQQIVDT